jgi:hypothetical protein
MAMRLGLGLLVALVMLSGCGSASHATVQPSTLPAPDPTRGSVTCIRGGVCIQGGHEVAVLSSGDSPCGPHGFWVATDSKGFTTRYQCAGTTGGY